MFRLFRKEIPFLPALSWGDFLTLGAGVGVYVALASSTLTKFSIWFDEAFGSYIVRFNFADLTRYTANDVHPPLYYWLLKLWTELFGNTELGIRSMSLFFGAVTVVLAFLLVVRLFGRRAAYVSLLLLVLSPMFIRYGQEARMYTLLTTIVVAATYVLVYAQATKKRWAWVIYGVLLALGMLTQYFAALTWVAHFVWRFLMVRKPGVSLGKNLKRVFDKQLLTAYGVALVLFAAWLPFLVMQFLIVQGYGFWIKPISTVTLPDFVTNVLLFTDSTGATSWLALGTYALIGIFGYLAYRVTHSLKGEAKNYYLLLICMVVVPLVLLVLLSMPPLRSAFVDRYLIVTAMFFVIFIGVTLTLSYKLIGRVMAALVAFAIVGMFAIGIMNQSVTGNYNKASNQSNNARQIIDAVRAQASARVPIIAATPWIFYESVVYTTPNSPIYFVDETTKYEYGSLLALKEDDTFKIKDVDQFAAEHDEVWIISNLKETEPTALRDSWQAQESVVVNDDKSGKPLYKATRFIVE